MEKRHTKYPSTKTLENNTAKQATTPTEPQAHEAVPASYTAIDRDENYDPTLEAPNTVVSDTQQPSTSQDAVNVPHSSPDRGANYEEAAQANVPAQDSKKAEVTQSHLISVPMENLQKKINFAQIQQHAITTMIRKSFPTFTVTLDDVTTDKDIIDGLIKITPQDKETAIKNVLATKDKISDQDLTRVRTILGNETVDQFYKQQELSIESERVNSLFRLAAAGAQKNKNLRDALYRTIWTKHCVTEFTPDREDKELFSRAIGNQPSPSKASKAQKKSKKK